MIREKNIKKIFTSAIFTFIFTFAFGVMNVNAETVMNEETLIAAVDGIKVIDGVSFTDYDTTEVKLGANITLTDFLDIKLVTDLTIDLNGFTIDGETNSKSVGITYGSRFSTSNNLTIKDSSNSKSGTIKSYKPIYISNSNLSEDTTKNYKLTIEGGKFYSLNTDGTMFNLSSENDMKDLNITFDFKVKNGYFEVKDNQTILLLANKINANNVTLKVAYNKLTFKGNQSRLICSDDKSFTVADVVSVDSNIKLKDSRRNAEGVLTDRTLSATTYNEFYNVIGDYDTIEITRAEGFDIDDITLNKTYSYTTSPSKVISINNRGVNSLKIKNVTVDSSNFTILNGSQTNLSAGETDTTWKIEAKSGLNAGTYTGVITVTDENNDTYTANVKVIIAKKQILGLGAGYSGDWMYGETPATLNVYGVSELTSDQYTIDYSEQNSYEWSTEEPTIVGSYSVRIRVTDPNYDNSSASISNFNILPNNTEIKIIANSHEWTYDGNSHSDNGYKVYYGENEVTNGILPTGDSISAVISGSVKDVKDTVVGNNVVSNYTIANRNYYSNVTTTKGTLTINPNPTPIVVKAGSATKEYDGSALIRNSYTYTDGVLADGDNLTATITGSQTYVGTSNNIVSNVKVIRGIEDVSDNYTFGTHINGNLTVTAVNQSLTINNQYVRINGKLFTSELEAALTGAYGNVSFEKKSGDAGEYDNETIGGFLAGSSEGTAVMTAKAAAYDVNNDGTAEYNATEKDFNVYVVNKEPATISGIDNNQEFTYDGNTHTPVGTLTVTDNKVSVSELEVSYTGIGSTTYSSTIAPTNAGTYSVTYKVPNSNANYVGEATFNFTIKKAQLSKVTLKHSSYTYTGEFIDLEFNGFDGNLMSFQGGFGEAVPTVKKVKTYNFSVSLMNKSNYEWADGTTDDIPLTVFVTKANPSYEELVPTNLTGLKGQTLNDITLPSRFTWNNANTSLIVGTHTYTATYTPSDTDNYNVIENIEITIVTKDIFNVTTSVTSGEGTINGPFMNVVEGTTKDIIFTPEIGYMIDKVLVNGIETTITNNKLTLSVDGNKNIKVSYKKIPFTITVVDTEGVKITPDGIVSVNYGESKEFTITTNSGYRFIKVLVNDVDKTEEMTNNKLTLNNITKDLEFKVVVERFTYEVIDGANQTYTVTKDNTAKFRINADYSKFENGGKVYIDDKLVTEENYASEEGSTIITLKQSYVDTLTIGVHTLKVIFNDNGEASTKFTVAKAEEQPIIDNKNPKTGDNIELYITTGILSAIALIGATIFVIKRKEEN